MEKIEKKITEYLLSNSCRPSLSGFNVLVDVIALSADDPSLKCADLFSEYAKNHDGMTEKSAYHAARYCIDNSLAPDMGVYRFIKGAALYIGQTLPL